MGGRGDPGKGGRGAVQQQPGGGGGPGLGHRHPLFRFGDFNDAYFTVTLARPAQAGKVTISATLNGKTTTAQLTILGGQNGGGQQ
jgi:hypothetical protein